MEDRLDGPDRGATTPCRHNGPTGEQSTPDTVPPQNAGTMRQSETCGELEVSLENKRGKGMGSPPGPFVSRQSPFTRYTVANPFSAANKVSNWFVEQVGVATHTGITAHVR